MNAEPGAPDPRPPFRLFEVWGIEIEYILVQRDGLAVLPAADALLEAAAGGPTDEVARGDMTWSNELVLHLVEFKVTDPVADLAGTELRFAEQVRDANRLLAPLGGRLMPGGAHPWMDPDREARLWPHDGRDIYAAFDRIFGCRTHGWTNLQSMHINLPFADDREFARLHAAVRLLLPVLPALAASSPFLDGAATGLLDSRLEAYRTNAQIIPAVAGKVIPEPIFGIAAYQHRILEQLYREMAPYDEAGILRYEWVNARGAIPRFERNTLEIRVLDAQECPTADLSIAWATAHVLQALASERWGTLDAQTAWEVEPLRGIFLSTVKDAERAVISDRAYLDAFGFGEAPSCTAGELWAHLCRSVVPEHAVYSPTLKTILARGPLARRLLHAAGAAPDRDVLTGVYGELCTCLEENRLFIP